MKPIKRILIIRFRQIGDSILAVALCSTLKKSFPDAEIHFVLNKNIAPLYEGHPDIDKVITFDKNENKPFTAYIKKVWQVMHKNRYDVIIDMRSTIRTLFFSLFSLRTPFRIGRIKGYTHFLLNYRTDTYSKNLTTDMVQRNLLLAAPLEKIRPIQYTKEFKLYLTDREKEDFFPLILDFPEVFRYVCLSTIIAESEAVGFVCILSIEDELDDQEFKIAKIASDFLGKQLET